MTLPWTSVRRHVPSSVQEGMGLMIGAQRVEHGAPEVVYILGLLGSVISKLIGSLIYGTSFESATSQPN